MRYLKFPNKAQLFVWTPGLASRGDMIEFTVDDVEAVTTPVAPPPLGLPIPEPEAPSAKDEIPNYVLKYHGGGKWKIVSGDTELYRFDSKTEAEAKLAELAA